MDIRTLHYCVAISKELSFTKVAEQSHITQQALSHQIISLERELGYQLFNRTNRSVKVTPAGEVFIEIIDGALQLIEKAINSGNEFSMGSKGILSIAFTGFYEQSLVISAMTRFIDTHLDIIIDVRNVLFENAIDMLNNGIVDLICVTHFNKLVFSDKYMTRKIPSGPFKVLISSKHPMASKEVFSNEDLMSETLVLVDHRNNDIIHSSMLNDIRDMLEGMPKKVIYARDIASVISMVQAGMGYALSPGKYKPGLSDANLAFKEAESISKEVYTQFIWLKENNLPYITDFVDLAV